MATQLDVEAPTSANDRAIALYRLMSKVHHADARVRKGLSSGEIAMSYWPVTGQEAMSAGAALALSDGDQLVSTYRGLGDVVAKGIDLAGYFGEILGRRTGLSRGKAGAMGISDPDHGIAWTTGIVGAGPLFANGIALAASIRGTGQVVLVSFGDGATSIGYVHEAMNMAALWNLPVVFFCQNNAWAECTAMERYTRTARLSDRAQGYGMPGVTVDGTDPRAVHDAVAEAVTRARSGGGPTFVEALAYRLQGHYFGDTMAYADPDELAAKRADPPFDRYRRRLIDEGIATAATLDQIDAELAAQVDAAFAAARDAEPLGPEELTGDVFTGNGTELADGTVPRVALPEGETEELGLVQAIHRTLDRAMAADDSIILLGEDIGDRSGGGMFKITAGLSAKYGEERVRDTPIAESSIIGAALGASLAGLRPVAELMFMDFLGVAMDQIANHVAKVRYMSGGRRGAPLVIRTMVGTAAGAQHSQALEAWAMHTPGLKVVWPSTAADAAGLLNACLREDDPCLFIESMKLYYGGGKGPVPVADYVIPLGQADVKRVGSDVTICTYGVLVHAALEAAKTLAGEGVSVEVVDLRTLVPLDLQTVLDSVRKTKRLVVAHESVGFCGPGAEIAAAVGTELFAELAAPIQRVAGTYTPVPRAATLEAACRPDATKLSDAVRRIM
ncbi:alpha-ketoacid dehydrogenase subunit alpha/beta [Mycolicibacterium thermoresistibile]|uniref:3-methyl-2-oxobutanoate dehydrogenase subunit beta n=2 Tax=Mycolicibacterium thermoresistibile TaxID=1797 RepID=G7CFS1_MYCT3|nr:dehydrogenase E1 component subunit alpha/beta [Mycolicibacterium thermoresistibile]EHI13350.1 dehydrogenase E1 component [Mycolicibacterium thermoresistibile ATCC 19527]MCV7189143.1 dehydrogenase E1 component subunit alpha/beta [Mycolicibacterium thermoresistibile]GAT14667.1 pyruvate/2-oxoglutarate dehydrogenase complex, dehydrogenase component beta subunit [Mycolicibacterium thermoresistibile]SNW19894.1 pyruvate/2-oxoglutarate dehydrogenase complex, dehydrogenase component beta subunit [Myc